MKRGKPLQRKKRLSPVSAKRKKVVEQRREFSREQLDDRPWCEAGWKIGTLLSLREGVLATSRENAAAVAECDRFSRELHEPLTRARAPGPETILDPDNSVAICFRCHRWIHDHPADATAIGLLVASWRAP